MSKASGRRVHRYARTRAEAAKLASALKAAQKSTRLPPERETVGTHLASRLDVGARPTVRAMTHIGYEATVRRHLVPELGRIHLSRLAPGDVQAMMNRKLAQGLSARRVGCLRGVLRGSTTSSSRSQPAAGAP